MVTHSPRADALFRALADPTRRAILDSLRTRPRTPGDLAERFPAISRPAVSKHLRQLEEARLVRHERHGRNRVYHLEPGPLAEVDAWLSRYRLLWSSALVRLKEHVEGGLQGEDE